MKKEVYYICEICGYRSLNEKAVEECEKQGRPNINKYPIGLIYNDPKKGKFYENITFAVARVDVVGHFLNVGLYACRDNYGVGDTLEDDRLCGNASSFSLDECDVPDKKHPTFKRLVKALKKKRIPITIWDGKKAVPYKA